MEKRRDCCKKKDRFPRKPVKRRLAKTDYAASAFDRWAAKLSAISCIGIFLP